MKQLDQKVVVITGVGAGIGRSAARIFVEAGATVFGVDINLDLAPSGWLRFRPALN